MEIGGLPPAVMIGGGIYLLKYGLDIRSFIGVALIVGGVYFHRKYLKFSFERDNF